MINNFILYILIAIIPGLIWLFFFLNKDDQKESTIDITKIFYCGMLIVIPAGLLELYLEWRIGDVSLSSYYSLLKFILIVGLTEESLKYFVVRFFALKKSFIDEPIDIVLYMIIAGLGFATAENILTFISASHFFTIPLNEQSMIIAVIRFFGANLIHVICSGIIGIFIALSFYHLRHRYLLIVIGFLMSIFIHGVFNFSIESSIIISNIEIPFAPFVFPIILLPFFIMAIYKIKKMKSVCKIN